MKYEINLDLIKKKRKYEGFTMQQMADFIGLHDKSSYYKRENGDLNFQVGEIPIIEKVLKIPSKKIFVESLTKSQHFTQKVST